MKRLRHAPNSLRVLSKKNIDTKSEIHMAFFKVKSILLGPGLPSPAV